MVTCPSINWIKVDQPSSLELADIPSDEATRIGYLSLLNFQRYPGNDRNEKLGNCGVELWKRWKIYNYAGIFVPVSRDIDLSGGWRIWITLNDERTSCFRIFLGPTLPELNCLRRFNWNVENARIMGSAIGMDE